jgi:hypothetical protein
MSRDEEQLLDERTVCLLGQVGAAAPAEPGFADLARIRDRSAEAFTAAGARRRRLHVGRWVLAAAAVIAIVAGVWMFDASRSRQSYAFADVPAKLRKARTLHWKEVYVDAYGSPQDRKFETITTEVWLDAENGFRRSKYLGTARRDDGKVTNHGETFENDENSTGIYHSDARVNHWRVNPLDRILKKRRSRDDLLSRMRLADPAKLATFFKSGRETIRGVACDVWDGNIPQPSVSSELLVKVWIDPETGTPLRVIKRAAGASTGFVSETIDVLETDVPLAAEFFRCPSPPPQDYMINAPPESAPIAPFSTGGFGHGGVFQLEQAFSLPDGSLLLCWNNFTGAEHQPPPETFTNLHFGGELPVMPVTIRSLRTNGVAKPEIEFTGRHVAVTRVSKDGEVFIWSLFTPRRPPPPREKFFGYTLTYGAHPEGRRASQGMRDEQSGFSGGMAIESAADFDTFVRGVMSQMSPDAPPPPEVTLDRLLELSARRQ